MLYNLILGAGVVLILVGHVALIFMAMDEGDGPYAVYWALWVSPFSLAFFGWLFAPALYWAAGAFLAVAILSVPFVIVKWFSLAPERRRYRLETRLNEIVKTIASLQGTGLRRLTDLENEAVSIRLKLNRIRDAEIAAEKARQRKADAEVARRKVQKDAEDAIRENIDRKARAK